MKHTLTLALGATLSLVVFDGRVRTVEHRTRLLHARHVPVLTVTLDARILRRCHITLLCHNLPVDLASCKE